MMKRLIVTTQSTLHDIRVKNAVYIDKTKQIYHCIGGSNGDKYFFLSRPRRFGKSLLCSTLEELFLGNRKLFKDLWIDKSDWDWKKHPVIHFTMGMIAGKSATKASLANKLILTIKRFAKEHNVTLDTELDPASMFNSLIHTLQKKYRTQVVVIIDEYDKPILDLIDAQEDYKGVHNLLSDFYGQLKYCDPHLRFVFITGVYKFAQTSIFSNFNNLRDISMSLDAYDLVGYTQKELENNFVEESSALAQKLKLSKKSFLQLLKEQHNGYSFGLDEDLAGTSASVYNSHAINTTFAAGSFKKNIWFSTGTPTFLIKQLQKNNFDAINVNQLKIQINTLINSYEPSKITVESLFYYAGYQTIRDYDPITRTVFLHFPNLDVASAMADMILPLISDKAQQDWKEVALMAKDALLMQNMVAFKKYMNICLACIHHKLFTESENYYQTLIMLILQCSNLIVEAEVPTNQGLTDLVVSTRAANYVIELKLNKTAKTALKQIKEKKYFQRLQTKKLPIYLIGINCSSKTRGIAGIRMEAVKG